MIYFLASRKVRLANCQNLLIINVALSDTAACIVGVFRGLGIKDSKFIGVPKDTVTLHCAMFTNSLNSFATSGLLALLPLTIDRGIAVIFPLRYASIVTRKTCVFMFIANWSPIFAVLLYDTLAYATGAIKMEYYPNYHRCVVLGKHTYYEQIFLQILPFFLILILYIAMMFFFIKNKLRSGLFLVTASGIIMTSLLAYSPTVITNIWSVPMSYEVSQILTVTFFYTNGIINPLIYFMAHPTTQKQARIWWRKLCDSTSTQSSAISVRCSGVEHGRRKYHFCRSEPSYSKSSGMDGVSLSKVNINQLNDYSAGTRDRGKNHPLLPGAKPPGGGGSPPTPLNRRRSLLFNGVGGTRWRTRSENGGFNVS